MDYISIDFESLLLFISTNWVALSSFRYRYNIESECKDLWDLPGQRFRIQKHIGHHFDVGVCVGVCICVCVSLFPVKHKFVGLVCSTLHKCALNWSKWKWLPGVDLDYHSQRHYPNSNNNKINTKQNKNSNIAISYRERDR